MKSLFLILIFVISGFSGISQGTEEFLQIYLDAYKNPKDKLVKIGFSPNEVKGKLGNPSAVEGGFPDESGILVKDSPKMAGQMNYSTWFYINDVKELDIPDAIYFINGEFVSKDFYEMYADKDFVYMLEGKIISESMGSSYALTRKSGLQKVPIDPEKIGYQNEGTYKLRVIPVYCVIFDKGTQVVAGTKAYFMN